MGWTVAFPYSRGGVGQKLDHGSRIYAGCLPQNRDHLDQLHIGSSQENCGFNPTVPPYPYPPRSPRMRSDAA